MRSKTCKFLSRKLFCQQGPDAANDSLSQKRAGAIVKALEGLGGDGINLRAVGKGYHKPVADNSTEAGRAKNRRAELAKKK
ncbi:MAG: OmpA family protein [Bacteroidaceae bacterium]|nr:OmpA family protein [Bacteroidaceae bacterium]